MKRMTMPLVILAFGAALGGLNALSTVTAEVVKDDPSITADRPNEVIEEARLCIAGAFRNAGYSKDQADLLAVRSIKLMKKQKVEPFGGPYPADTPMILDPDSNPTLLITDYLQSIGKSWEEATQWATLAYATANGLEDDPETLGLDGGCSSFSTLVSWCEVVNGVERVRGIRTHIDAGCMAVYIQPCLPKQLPTCQAPDVPYVEIPLEYNPVQCQLATGSAECVWIRLPTNPALLWDCDEVFGCECFDMDELMEQCGMLNTKCCTPGAGCIDECPCKGH